MSGPSPCQQKQSVAGSSVRVHLQQLRWCGFCRVSRDLPPRTRALHDAYRLLTLAVTVTYLVQECVYAYQERSDMEKLARVMFLLLCHITSIAKQVVFHTDAERIDRMIAELDDRVYNPSGVRHQSLLLEAASGAGRFARAYSGIAFLTCTLWIVFPILFYLRGQPVEFPFWIYVDYSGSLKFTLVLLYSYYVTSLVGIANTTMDAFMATILKQCKTQLTILRINFENLPEVAEHIVAQSDTRDETYYNRVLDRLFLESLTHYRKISETAKVLQDIFGLAILVQFGISGWILCMAAYKIVSLDILSIEFASMTLFIFCILTELFLYCYYGNEVTVESDRMVESLYKMKWTRTPARFRRSLVVVMERAKRPLRPAAGAVIPLSLDTFITIIKSSYTFYAVLRQTK